MEDVIGHEVVGIERATACCYDFLCFSLPGLEIVPALMENPYYQSRPAQNKLYQHVEHAQV